MRKIMLTSFAVALAAGTVLSACGGGSSSAQMVRGQVMGGTQAAATVFGAVGRASRIFGNAVSGTQVIVKGPSGKLLATTTPC